MLAGNQQRRQAKQDAPSLRPFIQTLADIIHNASALWGSHEGLVANLWQRLQEALRAADFQALLTI
jgi:hypothetical protein